MRELTISEYANEQGITPQAVRLQIKAGKLKTSSTYQNNKQVTTVLLSEKNKLNERIERKQIQNLDKQVQQEEQETELKDTQIISDEILHRIMDMQEKLTHYAELAGQTKLLTDQSKEIKLDVEYWKNKFFEIQQEKLVLEKQNINLRQEIKEIEELKHKLAELESQNNEFKAIIEELKQPKEKGILQKLISIRIVTD